MLLDEILQGVGELRYEREEFGGISASLDTCSARQGGGNVIKVKAYAFFILQLNTPYPTELSPLREACN